MDTVHTSTAYIVATTSNKDIKHQHVSSSKFYLRVIYISKNPNLVWMAANNQQ